MNLPPLPRLPESPTNLIGEPTGHSDDAMIDYARQAQREAVAAAVPEGWKLVPIEPTEEMIDAYVKDPSRFFSARTDWAAMLAAAPEVKPCTNGCKTECLADQHGCQSECNAKPVGFVHAGVKP